MKIFHTSLLLLSLFAVSTTAFSTDNFPAKHSADFAWSIVEQGSQLVDVRTAAEYQAEQIDQAMNIPLDQLVKRSAELDPSKPVVVYCRSGRRSSIAADYLRQHGFRVYDAGTYLGMAAYQPN